MKYQRLFFVPPILVVLYEFSLVVGLVVTDMDQLNDSALKCKDDEGLIIQHNLATICPLYGLPFSIPLGIMLLWILKRYKNKKENPDDGEDGIELLQTQNAEPVPAPIELYSYENNTSAFYPQLSAPMQPMIATPNLYSTPGHQETEIHLDPTYLQQHTHNTVPANYKYQ